MRRVLALVLAVIAMLAASIAAAEPAHGNGDVSVAVAVNSPLSWNDQFAVAGSLHVGFAKHHAIRGTVGRFAYHDNIAAAVVGLLLEPDAEGPLKAGRLFDVGVGYQWFPRELWRGPMLEAGVLRRDVDIVEDYRFNGPEYVATDAVGYAVRGLVGWSWLFWGDHVFIATAVGLSIGRYSGSETTAPTSYEKDMSTTAPITRIETSSEFYLRIGGAFEL